MKVEDGELVESARDDRGREQTPVRAAADRQRAPGRDGKFPQLAMLESQAVGTVRNGADPVRNSRRIVVARVAAEAEVRENLIGPRRAARQRERRRSKCAHAFSARSFDLLDAPRDVGAELVASLFVRAHVCESMRGRFVAARDDVSRKFRVVRHRYSEEEERRACAKLVEQIEQCVNLRRELGVRTIPIGVTEPAMDKLVPVLEVDAQQHLRASIHPGNATRNRYALAVTTRPLPASFAR